MIQAERHVSIGDRPEGHGVIGKFNRDVVKLIAKICSSTGKKPDTDWSYVTATSVSAHNSSIHNPLSKGSIGVTPSEAIHGIRPVLHDTWSDPHIKVSIGGADPGSRQHLEAIATAHNKARKYAEDCRAA